jgi:polysaccharide pyruvyl transferase WcaK-like protein
VYQSACLGGGTLIGRGDKVFLLKRAMDAGLPGFSYGTGVVDPDFASKGDPSHEQDFRSHIHILNELSLISVRDSRSREILLENGLKCDPHVIGDPALSLMLPPTASDTLTGNIGMNFGISKSQVSMWGSLQNTLNVLMRVAMELIRRGCRITIFPMSWAEYDMAHLVAEKLGKGVKVENGFMNTHTVLSSMSRLDVLVGVKLHSVILAHCVNVPALMLAYQPKCVSYMDSMGMGHFVIRGDAISFGSVSEGIRALLGSRRVVIDTISKRKEWFQTQRATFQQRVIRFLDVCNG